MEPVQEFSQLTFAFTLSAYQLFFTSFTAYWAFSSQLMTQTLTIAEQTFLIERVTNADLLNDGVMNLHVNKLLDSYCWISVIEVSQAFTLA